MSEWWAYFKTIPTFVKIKYFIVLPFGILLFVISWAGKLADRLDSIIGDWVRSRMK